MSCNKKSKITSECMSSICVVASSNFRLLQQNEQGNLPSLWTRSANFDFFAQRLVWLVNSSTIKKKSEHDGFGHLNCPDRTWLCHMSSDFRTNNSSFAKHSCLETSLYVVNVCLQSGHRIHVGHDMVCSSSSWPFPDTKWQLKFGQTYSEFAKALWIYNKKVILLFRNLYIT